ncbi:AtpZ/AtpI family protein [Brevibacillus fluminis]|uniref:AtpZ/AtpI family protein n=1 Tax=Brevibacillus fluminis TaxID=511487 RepID=A0A3M8D2W7_9BACL|nr:AtpZ/AtpI family protein [Brevibacillus fluminis]RNB82039.1 AtpZ/AtpI family protein [Brevibacillus fluminis]
MSKLDNPWQAIIFVSFIGIDLAICVMAGVWLGQYLDRQFATSPVCMIIGLFLGLGIGIYSVYRLIRSYL